MPVQIQIPTPLRPFTASEAEVEVEANSLSEAIRALVLRYPELQYRIYDSNQKRRPFINIYINSVDIRQLEGLETELNNGDSISIVPSIAGG